MTPEPQDERAAYIAAFAIAFLVGLLFLSATGDLLAIFIASMGSAR